MAMSRKLVRFVPLACVAVLTIATGVGAVWFLHRLAEAPTPPAKHVIQQVRLIRPPPPPPEIEKPPPPPKEEQKVDVPKPQPKPDRSADQPPPGQDLGLDAQGVAGGDGFGLVARPGGRDLLAKGGDRFGWYASVLKENLLQYLSEQPDIRSKPYQVEVRLWLQADGTVGKIALGNSTGDAALDRRLKTLLAGLGRVSEAPPDGLPQPVRLRIVSRL